MASQLVIYMNPTERFKKRINLLLIGKNIKQTRVFDKQVQNAIKILVHYKIH